MCFAVYHCKCIDTWLVQDSDLCPLCKKSVIEDDDSADQEAATAGVSGSANASVSQPAAAAAAAASNISVQDDDEQAEDAPLLRGFTRQRPRRYGSGFPGTTRCT